MTATQETAAQLSADADFDAWSEFLQVAHGEAKLRRESAIELLRMERHDATVRRRQHIFIDSPRGPFIKFPGVPDPVLAMLPYSVAHACAHWRTGGLPA